MQNSLFHIFVFVLFFFVLVSRRVCVCVLKQGRIVSLSGTARGPLLHRITVVSAALPDWNELLTL